MELIRKLFTPPKSDYTDYYELSRFNLTWNVILYTVISLIPITIFYYYFDSRAFYPSLYATVVSYLIFGVFYIYRNYKVIGSVFMLHGTFFIGLELLFRPETIHVIELPWFFLFTLFSILVIGKRIGILILITSLTFSTIYFFFFFKSNIAIVLTYISASHILAVVMNLSMTMFLVAFILINFKRTHLYAENKFKNANSNLIEQSELIFAQNEEKTIMLKEIHHRVKNNLQVVSSLIRLQSFETEDLEAKKMFGATVNRVIAMALIHEKMYQKDNLSKINLADYLDSLSKDILRSYSINEPVSFEIKSELEIIGNRTIVPLALIFNELISNSLKHGFQTVKKGVITVDIKIFDKNYFIIKYQDNGKWLNPGSDSSFGIELINTFTEQLDGEVSMESTIVGTSYSFKLKNIE